MVGETELQPCSLNCLPPLMHLELPSGGAPAKRDNFAPGTPGFSAGAQGFGLLNFGVQGLAGIPRPGKGSMMQRSGMVLCGSWFNP